MKKTNLFIAALAIAVTVFTGCKSKKKENVEISNNSSTVKEFFANNGAKKQAYSVNVDNGTATITGDQGTVVTFPEGAFVNDLGQPVTGNVQIQLVEIYDQDGMVLSDRPTTSNGQILVSGGEIYIGATANGEQLELNDSTVIMVTLPSDATEAGMTLFTGSIDSSQFNWTQVPGVQPVQNNPVIDSSWAQDTVPYFYYDPSKYIFTISNLGWINCDRFYAAPSTTNISVICGGVQSNNMRAYLVFKDINSVVGLSDYNNPGTFESYMIPVGEKVTVIAFCLKDGKEYVATKDVTVTSNMHINLDLVESSEDDIVALIKQKCN